VCRWTALVPVAGLTKRHIGWGFNLQSHDWERRIGQSRGTVAGSLVRGCSHLHASQSCSVALLTVSGSEGVRNLCLGHSLRRLYAPQRRGPRDPARRPGADSCRNHRLDRECRRTQVTPTNRPVGTVYCRDVLGARPDQICDKPRELVPARECRLGPVSELCRCHPLHCRWLSEIDTGDGGFSSGIYPGKLSDSYQLLLKASRLVIII